MKQEDPEVDVVEPEVLPPEGGAPRTGRRVAESFGPIVAGLILDGLNFVERGSMGILLGMFLGGTFIYWVTTQYRLPVWQRMLWATAAGLYCAQPWLDMLPLATVVAALVQFWKSGKKD